jgi:hypothetical protein
MVLDLAKGKVTHVTLHEDEHSDERRRFGAVLQCLEVVAIRDIESGGAGSPLDLVAAGHGVMVGWRVDGEPPRRTLSVWAEPPGPDEITSADGSGQADSRG